MNNSPISDPLRASNEVRSNAARHTAAMRRASRVLAAVPVAFGLAAALGWLLRWPVLHHIVLDGNDLGLSSAIAFVASGAGILLQESSGWRRRLAVALSGVVLTIAACVGLQYCGVHAGLQRLAEWSPGTMPAVSWFLFLLCGFALLRSGGRRWMAGEQRVEALAALVMISALSSGLARSYLHEPLTGGALGYSAMVAFLALSVSLLLAHPEHGFVRMFSNSGLGGVMARRVIFAFVGLFVVLPWVRVMSTLAKNKGAGNAVLTLVTLFGTLLFLGTLYWCCRALEIADEMRSVAEDEVARSEQRFRCLTMATSEIVWNTDAHGNVTGPLPSWTALTGLTQQQVQGSGWLASVHPEDQARVDTAWQQAVRARSHYSTEYRLRRADGSYGEFVARGVPILDREGAVVEWVGSCTDISERKAVERMKDELVATVSHELRTPLASLRGFAELMLERDFPEAKKREFVTIIHNESRRLAALIDNFLDLQRIESGRQTYRFEETDVAALIGEAVQIYGAHPKHTVRCEPPASPCHVLADADRIRQVLANLLSNAIKYSPEGGLVTLSAKQQGPHVVFSISDSGIGIPAAAQAQLFSKFYRVETGPGRKIGGTGLGLALVRQIVEVHKGRVWVESREGHGSTFFFTLPAAQNAAVPEPDATSKSDRYILTVEDDDAFAGLVREHLQSQGWRVEIASSAERALSLAREKTPAAALIDLQLAGRMDGWDLLVAFKTDPLLEQVPIAIVTINDPNARGLGLAGAECILKSVSADVLRRSIRGHLVSLKGRRILITDDDADYRRSIRELLTTEGATVIEAANGQAAWAAIAEGETPDLLLVDLLMPDMDGFELLRRLRANPRTLQLPVVVLTGKPLRSAEKAYLTRKLATLVDKKVSPLESLSDLVRGAIQGTAE